MSREYLVSLMQRKSTCTPAAASEVTRIQLNTKPNSFVEFDADGLTATYIGRNLVYLDTSSIQSTRPASRDSLIFYFEMHVKELSKNELSVGFADSDFPMNKHPGQTRNSFGYMMDGSLFTAKKLHKKIMRMRDNDCIGCGINFLRKEIFFTHNGHLQSSGFKEAEFDEMYPTVGLHGHRQQVRLNFGQDPFMFSLETHIQRETEEMLQLIIKQDVQEYDVHRLVQSYLYFNGYFDTLTEFKKNTQMTGASTFLALSGQSVEIEQQQQVKVIENETLEQVTAAPSGIEIETVLFEPREDSHQQQMESSDSSTKEASSSEIVEEGRGPQNSSEVECRAMIKRSQHILERLRKEVIQMITSGRSEECLEIIRKDIPALLQRSTIDVLPNLHALVFIERIKTGQVVAAMHYACEHLSGLQASRFYTFDEAGNIADLELETLMGLTAVSDFSQHPVLEKLLSQNQRHLISDVVNRGILGVCGFKDESLLETVLKQLYVISKRFAEEKYFADDVYQFSV